MADVVPFLGYEDCGAAADWLVRAFGFDEVERFGPPDSVTHVTLRTGDGLVFLGHPGESYVNPLHLRERCEAVRRMYDVPWGVDGVGGAGVDLDLDGHVERARAAGARILTESEESLHGRSCRIEDVEGHRWMFQQR
jgi:uncharacterized glyoxalase superfamily protein PhnB